MPVIYQDMLPKSNTILTRKFTNYKLSTSMRKKDQLYFLYTSPKCLYNIVDKCPPLRNTCTCNNSLCNNLI